MYHPSPGQPPEMDLFIYNDTLWVWIYRPWGHAVLIPYLKPI